MYNLLFFKGYERRFSHERGSIIYKIGDNNGNFKYGDKINEFADK